MLEKMVNRESNKLVLARNSQLIESPIHFGI